MPCFCLPYFLSWRGFGYRSIQGYKVKNEARGLAFISYEFLGVLVHLDI